MVGGSPPAIMLALLCLLSNAANEIVLAAVIAALLPPFQPSLTVTSREDLGERDVRRLGTAAGLSFLWTPSCHQEEHAANYTHPRCRVIRLRAMTSFRKSRWADARSARAPGEAFWGYGKKRPGAFSAPSLSLLPNKGALGHRFRRRGRRLGGKRCANATENKTLVGPVWFQCKKPSTRSAAGLLKTLLHLTPGWRDSAPLAF